MGASFSISPQLSQVLGAAEAVCVLTGAGVSAESGVPTFRDADGLWAKYNPYELATPQAFAANPDLVWSWYSWRRERVAAVQPNAGHVALAGFASMFPRFTLITQNVDNLHARAGSPEVHELHGNIEHSRCASCSLPYHGDAAPRSSIAQRCSCGGWIRPGVVWFGESLPERELLVAREAAANCALFLSIGTSGQVYPAAELPLIARHNGAYVVEINTEASAISEHMHECIALPSATVLPVLLDHTRALRNSSRSTSS